MTQNCLILLLDRYTDTLTHVKKTKKCLSSATHKINYNTFEDTFSETRKKALKQQWNDIMTKLNDVKDGKDVTFEQYLQEFNV